MSNCFILAALISSNINLQKLVSFQEEIVLTDVHRSEITKVRNLINVIPGIAIRRIVCGETECSVTVGTLYGYDYLLPHE